MAIQKFKVGDMVIGNDPNRYVITKKGWKGVVTEVNPNGVFTAKGEGNPKHNNEFCALEPKYFDLVENNEYKIGDRVVIEKCNIESTHSVAGKIGTIVGGPLGKTYKWEVKVDGCTLWCDIKCHATEQEEKIVITHDGKTTTATMYCADGSKKTATARCAPEDTFDFKFGANLAMERLIGKTETTVESGVEWRVVDRKPRVGDYIRLRTNGGFHFSKPGDILKVDELGSGTIVRVYGRNHPRDTYDSNHLWNYTGREYEVVEKVTATEPKPEPPKYYNGKVVCITSDDHFFTVGKIYEIVDGKFRDNTGSERPMSRNRVCKVEDLNTGYFGCWAYKFIPLVEDENKPLTIKELMKMDGKKVWCNALDGDGKDNVDSNLSDWHIVHVDTQKLTDTKNLSYALSSLGRPYGYRAYLKKPTK